MTSALSAKTTLKFSFSYTYSLILVFCTINVDLNRLRVVLFVLITVHEKHMLIPKLYKECILTAFFFLKIGY